MAADHDVVLADASVIEGARDAIELAARVGGQLGGVVGEQKAGALERCRGGRRGGGLDLWGDGGGGRSRVLRFDGCGRAAAGERERQDDGCGSDGAGEQERRDDGCARGAAG